MKLRIRGNSLRLRLTKPELSKISAGHKVEESIRFSPEGSNEFMRYQIFPEKNIACMQARFEQNTISVYLPWEQAMEWANSDQVSLLGEQEIGSGETLKLLVEKDFFCLKPRDHGDEDESEMFTNPNVSHGKCGGH